MSCQNECCEKQQETERNTGHKREGMRLKAKDASLVGKICGAAVILFGSLSLVALAVAHVITADEARELCSNVMLCGFGVMAVFGTVDINLMLDKFSRR